MVLYIIHVHTLTELKTDACIHAHNACTCMYMYKYSTYRGKISDRELLYDEIKNSLNSLTVATLLNMKPCTIMYFHVLMYTVIF